MVNIVKKKATSTASKVAGGKTPKAAPKATSKVTEKTLLTTLKAQVDPLAIQSDKVKKAQAAAKKQADILAELKTPFVELVGELGLKDSETKTIKGEKRVAKVGKMGTARKVKDTQRLVKFLNDIEPNLALELMSFKLGDLDKYLTPEQLDRVLTLTNTSRTITFE